eukprot:6202617-Pleurochrysis_carterae.AAC.1
MSVRCAMSVYGIGGTNMPKSSVQAPATSSQSIALARARGTNDNTGSALPVFTAQRHGDIERRQPPHVNDQ